MGRGVGGTLQYVRGKYYSLNGMNLTVTVVTRRHPLIYITFPDIAYYSRRFDVRCGM